MNLEKHVLSLVSKGLKKRRIAKRCISLPLLQKLYFATEPPDPRTGRPLPKVNSFKIRERIKLFLEIMDISNDAESTEATEQNHGNELPVLSNAVEKDDPEGENVSPDKSKQALCQPDVVDTHEDKETCLDNKGSKRSPTWTPKCPPRKRCKKAGFDTAIFTETTHFVKDGLRHVRPYHFTFTTYCKGRWIDKQLIQVYEKEFRLESLEYYRNAIKSGKITVNGQIVDPTTVLKHNDLLRTKIHRHEQPVVGDGIELIENSDELVVVNKPSSIPVHPCGRFRHNTIVFILGKEYNLTNLHTVHRIDRLTSGVLMFAKDPLTARKLEVLIKSRQVQKIYLCKVEGDFPDESVVCEEPISIASHNVGVCHVNKDGKECKTEFKKVSFDGKCSIVKCYPLTGRMHQIRVHLQWLGYPIVNDPIYNHPFAWGPSKGKNGTDVPMAKILQGLAETRKDKRAAFASELCINVADVTDGNTPSCSIDEGNKLLHDVTSDSEKGQNDNDDTYDPNCSDCKRPWESLSPDEIVMYLHAWVYRGPDWEFKAKPPNWCPTDISID